MAEGAVLNMAEMIDLAIGTPEIGTVDFVMLHTVLHCLAQQLRCTDKNVEVRGPLAAFPVGRQPDDALTVMVSEFLIETDGKSSGADQETILVAERIDKNNRMPNTSTPQKGYIPAPVSRPQSAKSTAGVPSKEATKAAVKEALQKGTTAGGTVTKSGGGGGGTREVGEAGSSEADDGSEHEEEESETKDGTSVSKERSKGKSGGSKAGGGSAETAVAGQGELKSKRPEKGASGAQGAQEVSRTASGQRLQALPSSEKLSLVTLSKFNLLQSTVQDLKNRVYGIVPNNEELLEGVRSQTNMKGITDMWATVNVSSRLEAAEAGIAKLSSLMQDIVGYEAADAVLHPTEPGAPAAVGQLGTIPTLPRSGMSSTYATKEELAQFPPCLQHLKEEIDQVSNAFYNAMKEMDHKVDEPVKREMAMPVVNVPPPRTGTPGGQNQGPGAVAPGGQMGQAPGQTSPAPGQMSPAPGQTSSAPGQMSPAPGQTSPAPGQTSPAPGQMSPAPGQTSPAQGQMSPAEGQISPAPSGQGPPPSGPTTAATAGTTTSAPSGPSGPSTGAATGSRPVTPKGQSSGGKGQGSTGGGHAGHNQPDMTVVYALSDRVKSLENRMNQCFQVVFSPNGNILQQLNALQEQMDENMRSQLAAQLGGGGGGTCGGESSGGPSPELLKDLQGLMKLYKTVNNMQNQLQQVHETAVQLSQEKEERQQNINSLLEQVELLKALKLDREDMVEALADKADLRMLARKVSHDQFELACDDLSRGLEHALGKLNVQESLWQQALDDIQREIETKLDKVELSPLKEFFQKKMKQLQDNLKQMAALRREAEAAGTKSKLLTNVNCISCDAQAFMQTEAGPSVPPKPLQPTKSMKPYLTYELDSIRKSQATNVPQRNMHDWEKIDKQMTTPRVQKVRSETDKHLCNRYCGGSHTMTTPAQRVARSGHFVKQWGPEVLPLTSGFAAGDDGRIYKVSGTESVAVGTGGAIDAPPCTIKSAKKEKQPSKPSLTPDCRCIEDVLPLKK